jgi:flagellar biosynthesis regulator FlbT
LQEVSAHLKANRPFDALKTVRNLFTIEEQILAARAATSSAA